MSKFLYEKSISYQGYLIIPFIFGRANGQFIYSYVLLSELGYKDRFHKAKNPAKLYSSTLSNIFDIAKKHLDNISTAVTKIDYFKSRYTYQKNLIIVHFERNKCFYDHYPPNELRNIAAPKLFPTVNDCIFWVKQGLDRQKRGQYSSGYGT